MKAVTTIKTDRPVVLVPVDEYERMRKTIEIVSDPDTLRTIRRGRKESAEGKTVELENYWQKEM
jgi:PHD/YefM family antitoxin component YafN of YafNO toxin-antitoxin module